ncbi:hypothetical protein C173_10031 [Paenibacillus sp. FSL R7-277]|uniref:hypothetical protein n=1 Tax=Paenibacillus sp. FSL R7-277 TaxID=1227352 RepID=UPI0003E1EF71|nr:hypothetical protein [Paenibacillus sp. FSL R7-277]ETT74130.1 hypothetical protein C173_10031 [Paenibacillus sp. FSL R7-277]
MGRYDFIEIMDMNDYSIDQLKELDAYELMTPESKVKFNKWCKALQVVKQTKYLHPLIAEYQNELAYRKARDEEHQFRKEIDPYLLRHSKVEYRRNKAVLSMDISDKLANRAFRIMNCLIDAVGELGGNLNVHAGEEDNAHIRLFNHDFSVSLIETKVKRRSLLSELQSGSMTIGLRPMYEKIPSGLLKMEIKEILGYVDRNKKAKSICYSETLDRPFEEQIGEFIADLLMNAIDISVYRHIVEREFEIKKKEQERLCTIEEAKKLELKRLEEYNLRRQHLTQNIENQMNNWFKAQKLRGYTEELERFVAACMDETEKELITTYIQLVREAAEDCDPVKDILSEMKTLEGI